MKANRPDPDALLAQLKAAEGKELPGRLKVFFGAAPGVGKTYAMLGAAQELRKQGVDVVVGLVETHGRAETEALLEGLAVLPRQAIEYRGRGFEELDLDALLARHPRVALVDELAHTNIPGVRHQRRYQDVEELLDAGIDVFTTLNVQHLESLNDVVEQITGVRVRETVPDSFMDRLRDIVLIDLPPRELIERLRQGKVYVPERALAALDRFFSPSNLTALRELAMQIAADRVDSDLRESMAERGVTRPARIRPRILMAVDGHEHTEYLVRVARRFAERRQAPWTVAWVDTGSPTRTDRAAIQSAFQLAQRLGGDTVILRGANVADELVSYAARHGVSSIVIGRTRERPFARMFNRTITQQLLTKGDRFELTIVNTPTVRMRARRRSARQASWRSPAREYGFATAMMSVAVLVSAALQSVLTVPTLALVFVCAVLVVAVRSRMPVAIFAALLGFLAYNFFFTAPRFTLRIHSAEDVTAVFAFLIAALICGRLATRLHAQVVILRTANDHARELQELGTRLTAAIDEDQVFRSGAEALGSALGCEAIVLHHEAGTEGALRRGSAHPANVRLDPKDLAAADWVATHAQSAGRFTGTLSASPWLFLPMVVEEGCLGAVGLRFPDDQDLLTDEQRQLAEAIVRQTALAADRARLAANLETARVESETERLRTALLSSVSHDLRSPLSSIIGAATSLSAYGSTMDAADRQDLLESIRSEGERLDRYIQNLLDMTRLGSGPIQLRRGWIGLDEILGSAVTRLRKLFPAVEVRIELSKDLAPLWVHPALIEQALFNILENAAKFTPESEPITVIGRYLDGKLVVDIADRGPGIPEEERRRIFDLFYSAARGDRGRGTGLGLAIVHGLIGAHQGKVEALAGPGGTGTTIRVTLPLATPSEESPKGVAD